MKLAPYIPLAGFLCNIFFAVFVFAQNPKGKANRIYLELGLAIAIWNLGSYRLFVVEDHDTALFWARICFLGVIPTISGFFRLSLVVAGVHLKRRWVICLYCFQAVLLMLDCTPYFLRDVQDLGPSGWYGMAGPAFHLLNVPYVLSFFSLCILVKKRKSLPRLQRHRFTAMILAQILLFGLGLNDLMPIIGITHYPFPFSHTIVYPFGSLAAVFYGIIIAYSVLHHQLLDVQVALSRAAAHAIRFVFLFFMSSGLLLLLYVTTGAFNTVTFLLSLGTFMVAAVISSITFPKLFGGVGMEKLERRILGDRFEYHDQINNFISSMQWYSDTTLLLSDLHDLLTKTVRLRSYEIILLDETTHAFSVFRAFPDSPVQQQLPELHTDSPIFRFFQESGAEYLALNIIYGTPGVTELERDSRESLQHFRAEFCVPFLSDEEPFGLMLLGEKINGDPYTATDISLMVTLVKNLSLMINQIRLKNQIQHAQELELLGRMSRGMAHDLNNLLTPIWTLLQLVSEGVSTEDVSDELLPVALRNIKTMRAYIRESLFFSENLRPDFQLGRLDMQIAQAIDLTAARRANKQINVVRDTPGEVLVEMDEVLIQRLIANIIANASDASPANSTIRVELVRLVKTEINRDWLRVRVIDSGEGIKQENLNRIFTPYFTTKDRGDQDRGFGLGLAICRKIVNLHGGNLNVFSQVGKGTTVQIDLPSRQIKQITPATMTS